MTAIIAVNMLRARDRWPTNYTTLSGIKSNPAISLNGSAAFAPLGLGNANSPFVGSAASISRNESANAEYSVNPFSNNDKTQGLLRPIQAEQLQNYWLAGSRGDKSFAVRVEHAGRIYFVAPQAPCRC